MHSNLSNYKIIFSRSSEKFLEKLDEQSRISILKKVKELRDNSKNLDIKKLKSNFKLYRLRVGNFRVVYSVKHERVIIYIVAIDYRKDVYKSLNLA
ncbi:MAG: type II toxin-antitoxin system RelE/ParE family toxin [bacterium]